MKVLHGVERFATPMFCIVLESESFFSSVGQKTPAAFNGSMASSSLTRETVVGSRFLHPALCFARMMAFLSLKCTVELVTGSRFCKAT